MKKNLLTNLVLVMVCLISCKQNSKTSITKPIWNEKLVKLDTLFTTLHNNGAFNGNVLIAENGNTLFLKSYGLANEQSKEQLNEGSIFELASVSKQFTAMGIVQLKKEGKLSFDDFIDEYVPELKEYKKITIRNLLNHTGGLPDYMELLKTNWDHSKIATNDDVIKIFERVKPKKIFEPNEKWEYSNTGYLILATIIERVSGKGYGEYLNKKIFNPLDMQNTFVYRSRFMPMQIENYAKGYIYSDSLKRKILPDELGKESYFTYLDGIVGDGMVNSNLKDLLKWDRALYKNKLIDENYRNTIFSAEKTNDGKSTNYSFGWKIDSTKTYGKIVSHSGSWAGYISYMERDIDNDKTIIILQNNSLSKTKIPVKQTRKILYQDEI